MSTILKALRRLEEEKSRDGTPRPLREQVASGAGDGPRRRWTWWLPILALAVGAGLGGSAWFLWPSALEQSLDAGAAAPQVAAAAPSPVTTPAPPQPVVASPPPQPVAAAPEPDPAPDPEAEADAAVQDMTAQLQQIEVDEGIEPDVGPPEDAYASDVEVVARPKPSPRIEPAPEPLARAAARPSQNPSTPEPGSEPLSLSPPKRTPSLVAAGQPVAQPKVSSRAQFEPKATIEPDPVVMPPPEEPPVHTAAAPKPSTASAPKPAPKPKPAAAPAAAPAPQTDVYVMRTQWHPEHARREAEVSFSGKERSVKEGDVVGDYVVNEIKPSGVVLTRDGQRVEQKIGKPPKPTEP